MCLPDGSQSKAFAEGLHYDKVRVILHERDSAAVRAREIDIGLIDSDNSFVVLVFEKGPNGRKGK